MKTGELYRYFVIACACTAIGAIANLLLMLLVVFIFAGDTGNSYIKWYFEFGDGLFFFIVSIVIGAFAYPFVKHLKFGYA